MQNFPDKSHEHQERLIELGEMVATVAHEMRNPLGGIRGFATLLQRDLKEQPQLQEMAQHIVEGADHLSRFVTHILNYSRPLEAHLEPRDLNELLGGLSQYLNMDRSIQLVCTPSPTPLMALFDAPLLQSALLNLIVNATQAMPEGGILTVKASQQGNLAQLLVSDTGIGIPPENRAKLFSPFFTTRSSGNGFGLAEVKKIVQAHHGKIDLFSEVGKGTTFTLYIPLTMEQSSL